MAKTGYKGIKSDQNKKAPKSKEKVYRTEWRVTAKGKKARIEVFDVSIPVGQRIHEHMGSKCQYALKQLEKNVLRYGESAELSRFYYFGMA